MITISLLRGCRKLGVDMLPSSHTNNMIKLYYEKAIG